jgi:hypothetical protein
MVFDDPAGLEKADTPSHASGLDPKVYIGWGGGPQQQLPHARIPPADTSDTAESEPLVTE